MILQPPQLHVQQYAVIVRRSLNRDVRTTAAGRTKKEAIESLFKNSRQYGYHDCIAVEADDRAPKPGSSKDDR